MLRQAEYHCAAHHPRDWMDDTGAEVAFAGRSNVGKSSAINAITSRKALARTSKTPGRTQQIIFFRLDDRFRLVDLPGYGYAKVPAALQQHWEKTVQRYLEERKTLRALILPVDCRREPTAPDRKLIEWCAAADLPIHILLTKCDKLGRGKRLQALRDANKFLRGMPLATTQLFSATQSIGVDEARERIAELLSQKA
ncbi:MAG TPA: YihA family ribosome biogenesis GTP-binding protein [Gammaproteobacteria bacterium]|nr:YihA family ribosome biogenesis GTP-binding protein [Gammaproteobacteria bacterium]